MDVRGKAEPGTAVGIAITLATIPGCAAAGSALGAVGAAIALVVVVVLAVAGSSALALLVSWAVSVHRAVRRPDGRGAGWAVVLSSVLLGMHLLLAAFFERGELVTWLVRTAIIPACLVGASIALLALRGPARTRGWAILGVVPVVVVGLGALEHLSAHVAFTELPGRITSVGATGLHQCALLSTGQVACLGANYQGELGNGRTSSEERPGPVAQLDDATSLALADGVSCAIRASGGAVCWGGRELLRPPTDGRLPWALPESEGVVELAVTSVEIVGRRDDGSAFGWPHALPHVDAIRSVRACDTLDGRAVCLVDEAGTAGCIEWSDRGRVERVLLHPELGAVVDAVPADDGSGCAVDAQGAVTCFRAPPSEDAPVRLPVAPLRSLVVLDGWHGAACGLDRDEHARCFERATGEEIPMPGALTGELFAIGRAVCVVAASGVACVDPLEGPIDPPRITGFDRAP